MFSQNLTKLEQKMEYKDAEGGVQWSHVDCSSETFYRTPKNDFCMYNSVAVTFQSCKSYHGHGSVLGYVLRQFVRL